jgi:hypothetical protein
MNTDNIEEATFEEVQETVPGNNVQEFAISNLGFVQEEDSDEDADINDLSKLTGMSDQYRKTDISQDNVFVDPTTGEIVDRSKLPPLEQIRIAAKNLNQTINEPHKNCKKCYGRGYTGINLDGNVPVPCSCIYEEYYKTNPDAKRQEINQQPNRQQKRRYDKQYSKYINQQLGAMKKMQEVVEKSKANLRKNTPNVPVVSEVVSENVSENVDA